MDAAEQRRAYRQRILEMLHRTMDNGAYRLARARELFAEQHPDEPLPSLRTFGR